MYELKREIADYQEITKAQPLPSLETVAAYDISDAFELWLDSLNPAAYLLDYKPLSSAETGQRAEPSPPSATPIHFLTQSELRFTGTLHLDGYFTGSLRADHGTLVLAESGEINTDISVGVARINGTVVGNITARERIELGSTARVIGDLHTPALMIQPGALFEGKCYFRTAPVNGNGRRRQTASRPGGNGSAGPNQLRARHKPNGRKTPKAKSRRS
jgi:cytoskeletal protein CcmA (bactofilin family)